MPKKKPQHQTIIAADAGRAAKPQLGTPLLQELPRWAPALTVSDIAEALVPIAGTDTSGTVQRLRHWGRAGVLKPMDGERNGPGNHLRYSADARFDAAVLHVLTTIGLPITHSKFLKPAMIYAKGLLERWKKAPSEPLPPMIVNTTAQGKISVGAAAEVAAVLTVNVDLAKLWAQVA